MWTTAIMSGSSMPNAVNISGNVMQGTSFATFGGYWNASTPGADCEVFATIGAPGLGANGLYVRTVNHGANTTDGYELWWTDSATKLYRIDDGVMTEIDTTIATEGGAVLRLEAIGSAIKGYANDVEILAATDTTYTAGGRIGLTQAGTIGGTIDNFGGGTLPAASFPRTGIVDEFNRGTTADGGTSWSGIGGGTEIPVSLNKMAVVDDSTTRQSYWNADPAIGPDCEIWTNGMGDFMWDGDYVRLYARVPDPVSSLIFDGYCVEHVYFLGGGAFSIYRVDDGTHTTIDNASLSSGSSIGLECSGSTIKGWRDPAGLGWAADLSAVDSAYSAAGYVGVQLTKSLSGG